MSKLSSKIAFPMILAGAFAITVFIALDHDRLDFSFYLVIFLLAVYVFFFGFATGQNFASPIKKLLDKAEQLSHGNLSSRVYLETKDELADLAIVFNEIAQKLEESRNQEEKTEKSVDIKVRARTKALEETINALEQKVKNRTIELDKLIKESGKIQENMKTKETETVQLKKELTDFKQKLGKDDRLEQEVPVSDKE